MMWLARMFLSKEDLFSCHFWDSYAWHKAVWDCLPSDPDAKRDFLHRIIWLNNGCQVYLLSQREPVCPKWCPIQSWASKKISPTFLTHKTYCFDLLANPTKKLVVRDDDGQRCKQGHRVSLLNQNEQLLWLQNKAKHHGFMLDSETTLSIDPYRDILFERRKKIGRHVGVRFRGVLHVTDRDLFTQAFNTGIGSAKSFGFGMLMLQSLT
ncbi:MAG: type I-E CRISPR-associated protein Cas6/Cse3/CasE [Desulfovibrionaceae bacterium]|nr:type I-E CRISPR-associated protein Cas6/Cse3/CasE [Desulfovibrionaceae bacterium]